ncbi:MAG: hypothetical protein AAF311_01195 [Pseudomonadota bacterium]
MTKTKFLRNAALALAVASVPALAQANRGASAGNCAIQTEMLAELIQADARVSGTVESEAVDTLTKFSAHLSNIVEAGMAETYEKSAAFGYNKASVDRQMEANMMAIRAGFITSTMEPNQVYMDHLLVANSCGEQAAQRGELGAADVQKLSERMNAVYMAIR